MLEPSREKFCQLFIETGSASEAYRLAFPESRMNRNSLAVEACKLKKEPNVSLRIQELREMHQEKHNITVESLLQELEEARQVARDSEKQQPAAMVSATMGEAKLLGLDKQIVDITTNGESINNKPFDLSGLSDEQLKILDTIATQASKN